MRLDAVTDREGPNSVIEQYTWDARSNTEAGHKICWKEMKVLQIEPDTTYRKYKESAHMSLVDHPVSQPSFDVSPNIAAEVRKLQLRPM
jgi:hypothetical protein